MKSPQAPPERRRITRTVRQLLYSILANAPKTHCSQNPLWVEQKVLLSRLFWDYTHLRKFNGGGERGCCQRIVAEDPSKLSYRLCRFFSLQLSCAFMYRVNYMSGTNTIGRTLAYVDRHVVRYFLGRLTPFTQTNGRCGRRSMCRSRASSNNRSPLLCCRACSEKERGSSRIWGVTGPSTSKTLDLGR